MIVSRMMYDNDCVSINVIVCKTIYLNVDVNSADNFSTIIIDGGSFKFAARGGVFSIKPPLLYNLDDFYISLITSLITYIQQLLTLILILLRSLYDISNKYPLYTIPIFTYKKHLLYNYVLTIMHSFTPPVCNTVYIFNISYHQNFNISIDNININTIKSI